MISSTKALIAIRSDDAARKTPGANATISDFSSSTADAKSKFISTCLASVPRKSVGLCISRFRSHSMSPKCAKHLSISLICFESNFCTRSTRLTVAFAAPIRIPPTTAFTSHSFRPSRIWRERTFFMEHANRCSTPVKLVTNSPRARKNSPNTRCWTAGLILAVSMEAEPNRETYSEAETEARREAALKNMLATPHKPHSASKKGSRESQPK